MQTTKPIFAAALEERMKRQGVTQSPLSAISGVDQSVISRYIAAKVTPSLENAFALIRGGVGQTWQSFKEPNPTRTR